MANSMYCLLSYILQKKLDFNLKLEIADTEFVVLTLGLYVNLAQKWRDIKYFRRQFSLLFSSAASNPPAGPQGSTSSRTPRLRQSRTPKSAGFRKDY